MGFGVWAGHVSSILFIFHLQPCDPARDCASEQDGVRGVAESVSGWEQFHVAN
jgi:hypothetical protein